MKWVLPEKRDISWRWIARLTSSHDLSRSGHTNDTIPRWSLRNLVLEGSLFDLIIENVPGARGSDDPNSEWVVVTAVATRTQIRSGNKDTKSLEIKK